VGAVVGITTCDEQRLYRSQFALCRHTVSTQQAQS
jgi:hypothetical protein